MLYSTNLVPNVVCSRVMMPDTNINVHNISAVPTSLAPRQNAGASTSGMDKVLPNAIK